MLTKLQKNYTVKQLEEFFREACNNNRKVIKTANGEWMMFDRREEYIRYSFDTREEDTRQGEDIRQIESTAGITETELFDGAQPEPEARTVPPPPEKRRNFFQRFFGRNE